MLIRLSIERTEHRALPEAGRLCASFGRSRSQGDHQKQGLTSSSLSGIGKVGYFPAIQLDNPEGGG